MRITRRCSTSEASSASRVSGVSRSRKPWAASRYVRSSDSAVPDRAASRFASAIREDSSARSAACSERTASTAVTSGDREHAGQSGGQPAQPPPAAGLGPGPLLGGAEFRVGARLRRVEEVPLQRRSDRRRRPRPSRGRRRAGRRGAARRPARPRRCHSWAAGARCRRTPRPAASSSSQRTSRGQAGQQRLVRDVEQIAVDRRAAAAPRRRRSTARRARHGRRPGRARPGERPPDERPAVVGVGQPDEQAAGGLAAARRRAPPRRPPPTGRATP